MNINHLMKKKNLHLFYKALLNKKSWKKSIRHVLKKGFLLLMKFWVVLYFVYTFNCIQVLYIKKINRSCRILIFWELRCLTLSWRGPLSYRNQSIDYLLCKSVDWFLYDNGPCHERVKNLWNRLLKSLLKLHWNS